MKKKILFSFIFIFVSLFFTINVKAARYSGDTYIAPSNIGTYPNYVQSQDFYDKIRDVFNQLKATANPTTQALMGSIDDYVYVFANFAYDGTRNNWYDIVFTTEEPTFVYDNNLNIYKWTLTRNTNARSFRYFTSYYSNRYNYSFAWSNWETGDSLNTNINKASFNYNYANNNYFTWGNNMTFSSDVINYLSPNISSTNFIQLNFNYNNVTSYNPNFLNNNSNWVQHCLSGQDTFFSVLPSTIDTSNHDLVNNFILFPYLLNNYGINWLQYNTINSTNLYENNYDVAFAYDFKLNSEEEMDSLLSDNLYIQEFNSRYSSLYNNLYGWNIFLNRVQYTNDDKYNIQVFHFNNSYTESVYCHIVGGSTYCEDSSGVIHGGGGHNHDDVVDTPTRDICFYIPSNMVLKVWSTDDFGDINDTITLNGTDYDINTDSYKLGYNYYINNETYSGYVGYFKSLINACRVPLNFISSKITMFFNSMPPLIQYALITFVFISIVIGLIKFLTGGK